MNKKIYKKYTNPSFSGSFSGIDKFYRSFKKDDPKINKNDVINALSSVETYTLHKPIRKKFSRAQVLVSSIDDTWQIDLVDMADIAKENKGFRYLLTVIDVLSKFAWVEAIKTKDKISVTDAFKKILKQSKRCPKKIHADNGKEFYNSEFKNLLEKNNIKLYSTYSDLKASIIERFNRTFKQKMWRMFTLQKNHHFLDNLQKLVTSYNNTYHRSIKTTPGSVNKKNEKDIWMLLYGNLLDEEVDFNQKTKPIPFMVGDLVRITKYKYLFDKGYIPNWRSEIFIIYKIIDNFYKLKDLKSEIIEGLFYKEELQKVGKDSLSDDVYVIDEILKTRKNKKNILEKFVSFIGKPESENKWITEELIEQ